MTGEGGEEEFSSLRVCVARAAIHLEYENA